MTALKYENAAKVGERIRAYDHHRTDIFIEGTVQSISDERGYSAFVITVERDQWVGEAIPSRIGQTVFVPMESTADRYWPDRVVNLCNIVGIVHALQWRGDNVHLCDNNDYQAAATNGHGRFVLTIVTSPEGLQIEVERTNPRGRISLHYFAIADYNKAGDFIRGIMNHAHQDRV